MHDGTKTNHLAQQRALLQTDDGESPGACYAGNSVPSRSSLGFKSIDDLQRPSFWVGTIQSVLPTLREVPMTLPLAFLLVVLTIGIAVAFDMFLEV